MVAAGMSGVGVPAAQATPSVLVSQVTTDPNTQAGEAWVVTDPHDPDSVMVVWLATRSTGDPTKFLTPGYCGVAVSSDGGHTWPLTEALPFKELTAPPRGPILSEVPICGDPVAGVGPNGDFYAAAAVVGSPSFTQSLTSANHGGSWSGPSEVFGVSQTLAGLQANAGHPTPSLSMGRSFMAVDPTDGSVSMHSQEDGSAEGRFLAVSTDRGATWSVPRPIDPELQGRTAGPHSSAFGTIGLVYTVDTTSPNYLLWPLPHSVTCPTGQTTCLVFATTADKGTTWTRHVMEELAGSGFSGRATTAADPTQPGRYAVMFTSGSDLSIWITDDSGDTWTNTAQLSAVRGAVSKPWLAFSPTGALGVVWRNPGFTTGNDVFAAVSNDGGMTFGAPVALALDVPQPATVGPGDDCACNLHLDATTLSATWTGSDTNGQRQMFYGRFDYTGL
jgi:hypothetical protein